MPDAAKAALLRALGGLVRGLSSLFWGLGLLALAELLIIRAETAEALWREVTWRLALPAALGLSALLWRGFRLARVFQPQERVWRRALDRGEALAVAQAGLSPFLYWWHQFPAVPHFRAGVGLMFFVNLALLAQINGALRRLAAMLPDESLRAETKLFTSCNLVSLLAIGVAVGAILAVVQWDRFVLPEAMLEFLAMDHAGGLWFALLLTLLPSGMTMVLMWKIKEALFESLTSAEG